MKPATEFIVLARKPLCGTVAKNVREHGTGALNIDGCRVAGQAWKPCRARKLANGAGGMMTSARDDVTSDRHPTMIQEMSQAGRWPANLLLSHAPGCRKVGVRKVKASAQASGPTLIGESKSVARGTFAGVESTPNYADPDGMETVEARDCVEGCPIRELDRQSGESRSSDAQRCMVSGFASAVMNNGGHGARRTSGHSDHGGASRFFKTFEAEPTFLYCAKASRAERDAGLPFGERSTHPTVKPLAVMEWLVTLVAPPGSLVLDPFLGSGTTAVACIKLGRSWAGAEITPEYWPIIEARVAESERKRQPSLPMDGAAS